MYFCRKIHRIFKSHCLIIKSTLQIHTKETAYIFNLEKLKHIFSSVIWTLICVYFLLIVLLHLPVVQSALGSQIADALGKKLGTKVSVGSVNLGILNRMIIDDVLLYDQKGDSMLYASRVSAKIDVIPLFEGKISIGSAQLFGLNANLYKQTAQSPTNFQFVLDSLASKDTTKHTPLDLHIGSIIIRHGSIHYNQRDAAMQNGIFSLKHIGVNNLSAHIILNHLSDNDINLFIKKIGFDDKSGLQIKSLTLRLIADKQKATLQGLELQLPHSDLSLGDIHATYRTENGKLVKPSLQFDGSIKQSKITLSDIACFLPMFKHFEDPIFLDTRFSGTSTSLRCKQINLRTGSGSINLQGKGKVSNLDSILHWNADIDNLNLTENSIEFIAHNLGQKVKLPQEVLRVGNIHYKGKLSGHGNNFLSDGQLQTSAGGADIHFSKRGKSIEAHVKTTGIALGRILDNKQFGTLVADITASGTKEHLQAKGNISRFDFNKYSYRNITLDGSFQNGLVKGLASIADPNINLSLQGDYATQTKKYAISAYVKHLQPSILGLKMADKSYCLDNISLNANNKGADSYLDLEAPFANLNARGEYDLATLYPSIVNLIAEKLPTLPGIKKVKVPAHNDFTLQANIYSTEIIQRMAGIPLAINSPIHINGNVSDRGKDLNLFVSLPNFSYNGKPFHGGNIELMTIGDSLKMDARVSQGMPYEKAPEYKLHASAGDNMLTTVLHYNNHSTKLPINGFANAKTHFFKNEQGATTLEVYIQPSAFMLGDTQWDVQPSTVVYHKNNLTIDHFAINHGDQHIIVSGKATPNSEDSIVADLKDVDVAYILNLVNFHSVDFTGKVSGQAVVKSIFQVPDAYANLDIKQFTFEDGPLGTLHANVSYNRKEEQIDIKAIAEDGKEHLTNIGGYVSPKRNYIDLGIEAKGTSMKFMESFCGSFMDNIEAWGNGKLDVVGDLSNINLVGDIAVHGKMHLKQLNTEYTFENLKAHAIPDDILLENDTIYDRNQQIAVIDGGIHHKHLTRLSYDLNIKARNFLGYDTHEFGDNTFYGTVYATGNVGIHGKSGETVIDIDARPEAGSTFVYNVASPDAISDKSFIHWHDATPEWEKPFTSTTTSQGNDADDADDIPSDMRINFFVNANPNLTLKLLMDEQTGDYITLNGNGAIKANYFNKGSFDMFGNYVVDHGVYKLTIQNIIKKDFSFMPGGTITFGGNPFNAPLNLQAKYTVNGVPLSDLNIGRSFSTNNIRVDCLMNIKGTPGAPTVDFSMDMPTVNSDAKQMIYSIINSQEEMNQQVLYLLGIGRFYAQNKNNQASEDAAQQSQASLAMQSFLSGTISQQINTVLSSLVNSNKWNFGANISTGNEGFNNAEYEGILSGRLLNNRLLFNGQFGYRDNANATQSFIGDFDLRYLIFPNGNLSIRMYNQSNDRYFTRNSLNTQGIGLIMKKDFNGFRDLFGFKKKSKKAPKAKEKSAKKKK